MFFHQTRGKYDRYSHHLIRCLGMGRNGKGGRRIGAIWNTIIRIFPQLLNWPLYLFHENAAFLGSNKWNGNVMILYFLWVCPWSGVSIFLLFLIFLSWFIVLDIIITLRRFPHSSLLTLMSRKSQASILGCLLLFHTVVSSNMAKNNPWERRLLSFPVSTTKQWW